MTHQQPEHYIPTYVSDQEKASWGQSSMLWGTPPRVVVNAKSTVLAYILWFFLGSLGIHKFYLNAPFMGVLYLVLFGVGALTSGIFIGFIPLGIWAILMFIDIFTIPLRVRILNSIATARANRF